MVLSRVRKILIFINQTPEEIISFKSENSLINSSQAQPWRDAWVVAKICNHLNITGLITSPIENDNTEIDVKLNTRNNEYNIQCVECKNNGARGEPKDHPYKVLEKGQKQFDFPKSGRINPYIHVHNRIIHLIKKKENKYPTSLCENLTLAIYVNVYWTTREDLKIHKLIQKTSTSKFNKIYLLSDGKVYRIKGEKII